MTDITGTYLTGLLVAKAIEKSGFEIIPVAGFKRFRKGLKVIDRKLYLYYNTKIDGSTHVVVIELAKYFKTEETK